MSPHAAVVALGAFGAALVALAGWILHRGRRSPEERERARRLYLGARGRLGDAEITGVSGNVVVYTYTVNGVRYDAAQDLTPFRELLPLDKSLLPGPATVRYHPGDPANSIVLGEHWSGIRVVKAYRLIKP